jgi:hypothetical protein
VRATRLRHAPTRQVSQQPGRSYLAEGEEALVISSVRSRLTYANVAATLALFLGLGGGAYAALEVTGADVRNHSLTGRDVRANSLTGKNVRGLTSSDFKRGKVLAGGGRTVVQAQGKLDNDGEGIQSAECPGSMQSSGGGFNATDTNGTANASLPAGNDAWFVSVVSGTPGSPFVVYVVCVS